MTSLSLSAAPISTKYRPLYSAPATLAILLVIAAWRALVLFQIAPPLSFDEAQYWLWAQDLQFGYYSKPPIVAWVIAATTSVCGDAPGCVKSGSLLAHLGTAITLFFLGRRLFGPRAGFWSAVTFLTLPAVSLSSMVISTDPFLLFFWALGLYALVRALDGHWAWWLGVGAAAGFGLLAKYAMVFFLASVIVYLAVSPAKRRFLASWKPWGAAVLAFLIYAPNLWWNAQNGFVSYLHTGDNANLGGDLFHPDQVLAFIGSQFGVFGPILFAVLLIAFARLGKLIQDERKRLLLSFVLPLLLVMSVQSLLSRANANWAAPVYVAASLLVPAFLIARDQTIWLKASLALHLLLAGALYNLDAIAQQLDAKTAAKIDPLRKLKGWVEIGRQMSEIRARYPNAALLTDERKTAASLVYYMQPHPFDILKWNADGYISDHYELTSDKERLRGELLLVTRFENVTYITEHFASAEKVDDITVTVPHRDYTHLFEVYLLTGYKGTAP